MINCGHGDDRNERLFVMQHMVNSMTNNAADCKNVWFVDLSASNYMISHGERFSDVRNLEKLGYIKTGDDTTHPIAHIGKVPLAMEDGRTKYLLDLLHILNITKNLVTFSQMVIDRKSVV